MSSLPARWTGRYSVGSLSTPEVRGEAGPPPGDSVAARAGRVYVAGLPQSNPFAPGSADATAFHELRLRPTELQGVIRFRETLTFDSIPP